LYNLSRFLRHTQYTVNKPTNDHELQSITHHFVQAWSWRIVHMPHGQRILPMTRRRHGRQIELREVSMQDSALRLLGYELTYPS
jgi:hypothetical protein